MPFIKYFYKRPHSSKVEGNDQFLPHFTIPAELKLALALRFFASGETYVSLSYNWRVAHNTISIIIREVCDAIVQTLGSEVVRLPSDPESWKQVSKYYSFVSIYILNNETSCLFFHL